MVSAWQLCWKNSVDEERKRNEKEARKSRFAKVNYAVREDSKKVLRVPSGTRAQAEPRARKWQAVIKTRECELARVPCRPESNRPPLFTLESACVFDTRGTGCRRLSESTVHSFRDVFNT